MDNGKSKVIKRIYVYGIVQGVGFRPLVYRIAQKYDIHGTVRNLGGYVEIIAQAENEVIDDFLRDLKSDRSGGSEIIKIEIEAVIDSETDYKEFKIVHSGSNEEVSIIPPDLPVCPDCQRELYEENDRRFLNPFISCMSCGPRYTIIEELPYDRQNTTMVDFDMCPDCNEEYTSSESRRFHAQTISCNDCGPYLIYNDMSGNSKERIDQEALSEAVECLKKGGILAVKGIGGYHLVCSPFMEDSVVNLRKLKGREEKPFAVMFETIDSVEEYCLVSKEEKELLLSRARPIVLLYMKKESFAPSTNKKSIYCGSFLPYTPLQMLLTKNCGPLIMTSANISDTPVIKDDNEILSLKSPYLNGILYNKRRIVRSVDDSVAKVIDHKPQLIRRSRGYVPYPVFMHQGNEERRIFAAGGDLKAAFCLYHNGSAVVSQYFGDLEENSVMDAYETSLKDLTRLLKIDPELAVCDMHPNYHSADSAKSLNLPLIKVQHHHAHIASVMAEHDLKGKVIGVAFDGTGYGTDGNIWGGEFLICEGADFTRAAHLCYTPMIGGDNSMRDARKTAGCFLSNAGLDEFIRDDRKAIIQAALKNRINTVLSSSMGRLFDAVASILDICQENKYEGECAALMEREATLAIRNNVNPPELSFAITKKSEIIELDPTTLLEQLCRLRGSVDTGALALSFHYAVADAISNICEELRIRYKSDTVALSGGVFQNTILTERSLKLLREKGFRVYVNMAVPPNDGCISLGQTYIGLNTHLQQRG